MLCYDGHNKVIYTWQNLELRMPKNDFKVHLVSFDKYVLVWFDSLRPSQQLWSFQDGQFI